jgi:hypothetical protein
VAGAVWPTGVTPLPFGFAYFLALGMWIFLASLVWLTAGLMSLSARTRYLSWPLCVAMAATFPFVFVYQIIAAPIVMCILLVCWGFWRILEPGGAAMTSNPFVIVVFIGGILSSGALILSMSLAGFYEGWRTGWACANGRPIRETMWEGPTARLLRLLLRRNQ